MNPADGAPNRVARLLLRSRSQSRLRAGPVLQLYGLDAVAMRQLEPIMRASRGELGYLSLTGTKDIVLASTGAPMPLLHVQLGPSSAPDRQAPEPDAVHMFCTPDADALDCAVRGVGHVPIASAMVLQVGMDQVDGSFVLTRDIGCRPVRLGERSSKALRAARRRGAGWSGSRPSAPGQTARGRSGWALSARASRSCPGRLGRVRRRRR